MAKDGSTVHDERCSCAFCRLGYTRADRVRCKNTRFTIDDVRCLLDEGHAGSHNFDCPGDNDSLIARFENDTVE